MVAIYFQNIAEDIGFLDSRDSMRNERASELLLESVVYRVAGVALGVLASICVIEALTAASVPALLTAGVFTVLSHDCVVTGVNQRNVARVVLGQVNQNFLNTMNNVINLARMFLENIEDLNGIYFQNTWVFKEVYQLMYG